MSGPQRLTVSDCLGLAPDMFVVNHRSGRKLAPEVARILDPVDPASYHLCSLPAENATDLHFHDHDEYWAWVEGRTVVSIRLPDGRMGRYEVGPGWLVYCVRGVEHGHAPLDDWACFEWHSLPRKGARQGHLVR